MPITHNFVNSNSIGGIGEAIFYTLLSKLGEVKAVTKDKEWQKMGVDFILDGVFYDTKFDTKAFSTGNVALETVSRRKDGKILKDGWAYTSEADCISYIFLEGSHWSIYFFTPVEIRTFVDSGDYEVKSIRNYGYESEVVLLPISEMGKKLKMTFPVVGEVQDMSILKKVHTYLRENKE